MITVRFPNGMALIYNDANDVAVYPDRTEICFKDKMNQRFYRALLPASTGCLIEWREPCKITTPPMATVKAALEMVLADLRRGTIDGWEEHILLIELKSQLHRFNAKKKVWK